VGPPRREIPRKRKHDRILDQRLRAQPTVQGAGIHGNDVKGRAVERYRRLKVRTIEIAEIAGHSGRNEPGAADDVLCRAEAAIVQAEFPADIDVRAAAGVHVAVGRPEDRVRRNRRNRRQRLFHVLEGEPDSRQRAARGFEGIGRRSILQRNGQGIPRHCEARAGRYGVAGDRAALCEGNARMSRARQ
jgi:hypothetical protein